MISHRRSSHLQFHIILAHSIVEEIKTELEIVHVALFFDTSIKISMAAYTKNYPSEMYQNKKFLRGKGDGGITADSTDAITVGYAREYSLRGKGKELATAKENK